MFASITIGSDEVLDGTGGDEGSSAWTTARKNEDIGGRFGGQICGVGYYFDVTRACRVLALEVDANGRDLEASADEHCGVCCVSQSVNQLRSNEWTRGVMIVDGWRQCNRAYHHMVSRIQSLRSHPRSE